MTAKNAFLTASSSDAQKTLGKLLFVNNLDNIIKEQWYPEDQVYVRERHWDSEGVYMKWQEVMSSFAWSDDSATSNMMDRDGLYQPKLFDKYDI